jgi:hypothetical protein
MRHTSCISLLLPVVVVSLALWPAQAAQVLSELYDSTGEPGVRPDMDIVSARVLQVDQDLLQFEIEVAAPIPRDPDPNHRTHYIWYGDWGAALGCRERVQPSRGVARAAPLGRAWDG